VRWENSLGSFEVFSGVLLGVEIKVIANERIICYGVNRYEQSFDGRA